VRQAHLEDRFVFTGPVRYDAISPYLVLSDVCVQLLNDWCMGTKVVMYMVHGRAVICGGGWFEQYGKFLKNGENSILIPSTVKAFSEEAVSLLKDRVRRARLGESARRTVNPYTWDRHADETLRLLRASTIT
jgi:glycosyltransferase involved in cell wall biosynthesis